MNDTVPAELITKKQLAKRLGVSVRTVENWMQRRDIPYLRITQRMIRFEFANVRRALDDKFGVKAEDAQ